MSADQQDMINHLMMQAAMTPQGPSLYGLQAQVDPNILQSLAGKMKQQQVLDQANAPAGGQYGYLHDAGKAAFNSIGSSLGGQLAAFGNGPAQGPSPQIQAQRDAITQGNQEMSTGLQAPNADPLQVQVDVLKGAAQRGVPGAAQALVKAQDDLNKSTKEAADTEKLKQQALSYVNNKTNQDNEQSHRLATEDFERQRIAIEMQRLGIERTKAQQAADGPDLLAPASPGEHIIAQKMADGDMKLPDPGSRSKSAARYAALALQINPDLTQELYGTRQKAMTAITSGPQGNQVRSFNVAYNHLDTVNQAVDALAGGDLKAFNNIANRFQTQTGGANATNVDTALAMVKGELGKAIIGTHPPEGMVNQMLAGVTSASSPEQLRGAAETAKELMLGQASGVKQQFGKSILGAHFSFDDALSPGFKRDLAAYESKRDGAPPAGGPPQGAAGTPPAGWSLHTDAKGNKAYVSPDGKQFQEVK